MWPPLPGWLLQLLYDLRWKRNAAVRTAAPSLTRTKLMLASATDDLNYWEWGLILGPMLDVFDKTASHASPKPRLRSPNDKGRLASR